MKIYILFFSLLFTLTLKAQDPHFTQMRNVGTYLNPALTGEKDKWSINLNYRNQWPEIGGTYITYLVGAEYGFSKAIQGLGVQVYNDQAGDGLINTTALSIPVSKQVKLSKNVLLRIGMQPVFRQKSVDWTRLTFGNQLNNYLGFDSTSVSTSYSTISNVDLNSGFVLDVFKGQVGLAVNNILGPNESFTSGEYRLPIRYTTFISYRFDFGKIAIEPMVCFHSQADFTNLLIANTTSYNHFKLLTGVRVNDAAYIGLGYDFNFIQVAYSYDHTYSKLSGATGGSHEVALLFRIGKDRKESFKIGL